MWRRPYRRTLWIIQAVLIVNYYVGLVSGHHLDKGRWALLLQNAGVSAMHMTLTHINKLLIFDQTLAGPSQIKRTDPPCKKAIRSASKDCWAHSIEYDIATDTVRPLTLLTHTFCSSAAYASNGTLIQTGGSSNETRVIRYFTPCSDATSNWIESPPGSRPNNGQQFQSSARMYHSTVNVLPNGRVLVAGSNSNYGYRFSDVPFPTELRVEACIPYYLHPHYDPKRVSITAISTREIKYGSKFIVRFTLSQRPSENIDFHAYAHPFTTHSSSMNERVLLLGATPIVKGKGGYLVGLTAPPSTVADPSGYYLFTIVNGGVPSRAEWIRFIS